MSLIIHTEDAFLKFCVEIYTGNIVIDNKDHSAIASFKSIISNNQSITENQAKFMVRLLKKYMSSWKTIPENIKQVIDTPRWKKGFRKLDQTKEVFIELDDGVPWVCLKFPYTLKESFEKEILKDSEYFYAWLADDQFWDKDRKIRKLNLYNYNILQIYEFVRKNEFKIDESFIEAVNLVEEIWNNEESILKKSCIHDNKVFLKNADCQTLDFFEKNRKSLQTDLLLSKSMGFFLDKIPTSLIEKISASEETWFWYQDLKNLINHISNVDGKIIILLDRSSDFKLWLTNFKEILDETENLHKTKICFRLNNDNDRDFNNWIKDNGFGGKVEQGKFLVFLQKPNKWLFSQDNDVKIVITNSIYPPNDQIAMCFLQSHPCVIFVGDVKPTDPKGRKIVSL